MKKVFITGLLLVTNLFIVCGNTKQIPDSIIVKYASFIDKADLEKHLRILASDEYEGRETGKKGQKMAAKYIADYFESIGIKPAVNGSYFQEFGVIEKTPQGNLSIDGKAFAFFDEFFFMRNMPDTAVTLNDFVFAGYGIDSKKYSDYKGLDVKGKNLIILDGEPVDKKGRSLLTGKMNESDEWDLRAKMRLAKELGAASVFIVFMNYDAVRDTWAHYFTSSSMNLEIDEEEVETPQEQKKKIIHAIISPRVASQLTGNKIKDAIAKITSSKKSVNFMVNAKVNYDGQRKEDHLIAENVLGFIPGTDLSDEIVVLTAHYDHIGKDGNSVYNGADDDGSGTVALLEIAQAFRKAAEAGYGPRRSVLIMPVSGEEKGLLGSFYYTAKPVFPLELTVANLNIDMIGRMDEDHKDNPDYVYLIGSDILSKELHQISEEANKKFVGITLDYRFNDINDHNRFYYRSDHYNFASKNIPVIFYFNGTHEDYHKETDEVDKIHFGKMEKITRLVFATAWEIANRDNRPALNTTK